MRRVLALALSSTLVLQAAPLMAAPPLKAARAGAQAAAATGGITGTAQSAAGQVLPNYTVQVRNLQTGQLMGSTTSNAAGSFSFAGLAPANYVVEIVNAVGEIVGSSASIAVAAGVAVTVTVSASAAVAIAGAAGAAGGISTAVIVTAAAVAAGVVGVVVAVKVNGSPSN